MLRFRLAVGMFVALGSMYPCAMAATGQADGRDSRNLMSIRLAPTRYNAGEIGTAMLAAVGDKTAMTVNISGVPDYTSRPVHLYSYIYDGTCLERAQTPRYALTERVLASSLLRPGAIGAFRGPASISATIPASFERLRNTRFAISVRAGPADGSRELFCGDNLQRNPVSY